jgi:surfactin family lipopeptide synthetase A
MSISSLPGSLTEKRPIIARQAKTNSNGPGVYRLSFAQARLWFLEQFQPGNPTYNVPWSMRLPGPVDAGVMERVFNEIVRRHGSLRTRFAVVEGQPAQIVDPTFELKLSVSDLRSLPAASRESEAQRLTYEESSTPFDLATGPLIRVKLLSLSATDHVLVLVMHHIVSDGWSMGVLYRELAALYTAFAAGRPSPLKELPIQYGDYAEWQLDRLQGEALNVQLAWWQQQLAGLKSPITFPPDRPRPAMQSTRGDLTLLSLEWRLADQLKALGKAEGATLFMTTLAAFMVLLSRYTGEVDLAAGSPVADRPRPELENLIGFFVNTLVMRVDLSGDPTFRQLLQRVREMAFGAYAHQEMPFEKLVEELPLERSLSHNPLFQVMFTVQNISAPDRSGQQRPDTSVQAAPMALSGTAKFDLTVSLFDTGKGVQGAVEYNTDLYDATTISKLVERYQFLLRAVAETPDRNISRLPVARDSELRSLAAGFPGPAPDRLPFSTLGGLLAARAAAAPEFPALIAGNQAVGNRELNQRVNKLARYILRSRLQAQEPVAVVMDRSLDTVIALLSVVKAGGAFVPLDPREPTERAKHIAEDAGFRIAISNNNSVTLVPAGIATVINLDSERDEIARESENDPDVSSDCEDIVGIIYRSSPEGAPQGVMLSHATLLQAVREPSFQITHEDRIAHTSNLLQDSSLFEIFTALTAGATLVCLPSPLSPRVLAEQIREHRITVLFAPLSMIDRLAGEFPWAFRMLRLILCADGAEAVTRFQEGFKSEIVDRLHILSGGIETGGYYAIQALAEVAPDILELPLGRSAAGVTVHLLDGDLRPVPEGIWGEICIGSSHLARGYRNAPGRTDETWITNPFALDPPRFCRTGEFARRLPDGSLSYPVRRDGCMAVRGVRMYPTEIEAALLRISTVREAAVVEAGPGKGFVAFVSPVPGRPVIPDELRTFLRNWLPAGTAPSIINVLDDLPRTRGGVDRQSLRMRLRMAESSRISPPNVQPRNSLEQRIARIWMQVFDLKQISIHDNFFQLGGHSLLATQVVARITDEFAVELPLHRLFDSPTIAELAAILEPSVGMPEMTAGPALVPIPRDRPIPLSFAQQRVWFLDQFEPDSAFYNIPLNLRLPGPLDVPALHAALNEMIRRHESLRTTFALVEGEPVQVILPEQTAEIPIVDLSSVEEHLREPEAQRLATAEAQRPFDLTTGPVLRAHLFRLTEIDHVLLLVIHHIVSDAWSTDVILRELAVFYDAHRSGRSASLPELPIQYADFAVWQRKWLSGGILESQLSYWMQQLDKAPGLLQLPTDRPRPLVQVFRGGTHRFPLPEALSRSVRALGEKEQTTMFMTLLAAFAAILYRYTGQDDIVVGTPIANRTRPELEGLIGFFDNTLALRTRITPGLTFRQLLAQVRAVTLAAYEHQDIPFEKLVEELHPERNLSHNPVFQVMLAFQSAGNPKLEKSEPSPGGVAPLMIGTEIAKFDLTLFITDSASTIYGGLEYNSDLFDEETVARMAGHFEMLLAGAVADPDSPLTSLHLLVPAEIREFEEWNATRVQFRGRSLPQMFEEQVERTPDAPAVYFDGETVTYRELNNRANFWAHRLVELGIGPDSLTAVAMNRSVHMIVAVLAILKAGGGYVPIDPEYPARRIDLMLSDAGVVAALACKETVSAISACDVEVLLLDADVTQPSRADNPAVPVTSDHIAYVIYTSGSTGEPKGVAMPHRSLANLVEWQIARSALAPGARTLQFAPLSFDVSCQEIFSTLTAGGTLVLIHQQDRRDPAAVWRLLDEARVNRLFVPNVALQQLAEKAADLSSLPASLTEVITAGEQLQITPQVVALFAKLACPLYNQYGPTETHVATELRLSGDPGKWPSRPTIGRPISNATIHILDEAGQRTPVLVPGEIHIGGEALARGYWRRQDLTDARFFNAPGGRMYRTGDRGRYLRDGSIEFLGRLDDQVKVRGFRVEPGEVEVTLSRHPKVAEAAVVVREAAGREAALVAYVQSRSPEPPTPQELRSYLSDFLPGFMIPTIFVPVDAIPLTSSGKLDRRGLPDPTISDARSGEDFVPPRTQSETAIARIWCEILALTKVGVRDNFFEIGGQSLLATRMMTRVNAEFGTQIPLRSIFEQPTIEALAISVMQANVEKEGDPAEALIAELEALSDEQARELLRRS